MRRRELLVLAGGSMTVTVAGCMGDDGSDDDNENGNETDNGNTDENGNDENGNDEDQPTPATFDVGDVSLNETTVGVQASVEFTAQITNSGEQSGTKTVEFRQDGEVVDRQELELDAGGEESVIFSPSTDLETGDYELTVLTEDGEGSTVLTIAEGEFVVENIDPQVAELDQGQPLTVSADVVNQGPVEDTKPVELRVDGQTVVEQEITLAAEGQESVEFSEVETSSLSLDVEEHSIWTPDDEALGSLTLEPVEPGTLELTVVDADGVGVGEATVTGDDIEETTDSEGMLTRELDPGEYDLTIASAELETTETVTIEDGETTSTSVELVASASISSLDGTNTGGFTAFDEGSESDARENGISFPPGNFDLTGTVSDGQWESTNVDFESFTVSGLETQVEAPNGLSGTFDENSEMMTVEGQLQVSVGSDDPATFSYEIVATTEESGELTGSADFEDDSGAATIVDNEFTVEESGDPGLDPLLGLPVEQSGRAWFELVFEFDFTRE